MGDTSACALLANGSIQCWGYNGEGQLGNNSTVNSSIPVTVSGITTATAIAMGSNAIGVSSSCALLEGGSVVCWGYNGDNELGNGTAVDSWVPVPVSGISNATAISTSCAVLAGGTVKCWGNNNYGELGSGSTAAGSSVPVTVSGITTAVAVSSDLTACAILSGGTIKCWGDNSNGTFGNNTSTSSNVPVSAASGITNATQISVGVYGACARLTGGSVKCWGDADYLGNGTASNSPPSLVPVTVNGF
jgi:alpha-tubulin suppressor-like RCC1 family protein